MTSNRRFMIGLAPAGLVLAIGLFALTASAAMPYAEDWSAGDTNGWTGNTTSSVVIRDATFGNLAGSIVTRRELSPPEFDIGATTELPAASGDYTGAPAWMISFDVYYDLGNYVDTWLRFRYQDSTFNGWHIDVADVFPNSWQNYSVMFDPSWTDGDAISNGWVQDAAPTVSWQQLMTDVYHPEVRLLLGDDESAIAHIDNFVIKQIPEPATVLLAGIALLALLGHRRSDHHFV